MSCHAPNDRLLPGDGPLDKSIEMYYCQLEFGHKGPHKCSGHPIWWDDSYHEVNDYSHTTVDTEDLLTRVLKAMLPADAEALACHLDWVADQVPLPKNASPEMIRRAAAILRGEP